MLTKAKEPVRQFYGCITLFLFTQLKQEGCLKSQKKLTVRKMFGQYHHALTVHAPQQFRIVPISSTNAENEERSFNFLKTISTQTSNHHPDNVISNAFIRAQVSKIAHQNIIRLK